MSESEVEKILRPRIEEVTQRMQEREVTNAFWKGFVVGVAIGALAMLIMTTWVVEAIFAS